MSHVAAGSLQANLVNIMAADALAPCEYMDINSHGFDFLKMGRLLYSPDSKKYQLPATFQCGGMW